MEILLRAVGIEADDGWLSDDDLRSKTAV